MVLDFIEPYSKLLSGENLPLNPIIQAFVCPTPHLTNDVTIPIGTMLIPKMAMRRAA